MSVPPARFRPLTAGDIIDEAIKLYRRHFRLFLTIGAIVVVPLAIIQLLVLLATESSDSLGVAALGGLISGLASAIGYLALIGAMVFAASETWFARQITVQEAFDRAFDRIGSVFGLGILYILAVFGMFITIIGIPFAIYFGLAWVFSYHALLLERSGIRNSLSRSRALVRGQWWRVLGIGILIVIIQSVISAFFSVPAAIFGAGAFFRDPTADLSPGVAILDTLGSSVGQIVAGPITYCSWVLLYYDSRIRKEGLDLELAVQELEQATGPSAPAPGPVF